MPTSRNGDFTVTITLSANEADAAIALAGDLDMMAEPALSDTIRLLSTEAPDTVTVNLAALTFVDSVLPNFLVKVRQAMPVTATLVVANPTRQARFILQVTRIAQIATIDPEALAPECIEPKASTRAGTDLSRRS
jgi:anti-anti-sigma factor